VSILCLLRLEGANATEGERRREPFAPLVRLDIVQAISRSDRANPDVVAPGVGSRRGAVLLAALLPAGVLVFDPSGWSPFGPSKWLAVSTLGLAGAAMALWTRGFQVAKRPMIAWVVLLGWIGLTAAVGLDRLYAWTGTPERHFGAFTWLLCGLAFLAGHRLSDDEDGRLVIGAGVLTALLAGAWAVAEELGWDPVRVEGGGRLVGMMGSSAYVGAAMTLLVPLAAGVALDRSWCRPMRWLAAGATVLSILALIGSGARAAWVGAALGAALVLWIRRPSLPPGRVRAAVAGGLIGMAVVGVALLSGVGGRVPQAFDKSQPGGLNRVDEWRVAVRVVEHHPLTGVGPEGYRIAFSGVVDPAYQQAHGRNPLPDRAHDSLLDMAATTGLPGVAIYLVLAALVAPFLLRAVRRAPPWLAGTAIGIVAYALQGLLLFPLAELEPAVWLLAGLVVVHVARESELAAFRPPRVAGGVLAGLAVVALIAGGRDVEGDRVTKGAMSALAAGEIRHASQLAHRAVRQRPDQMEYRLAAAEADSALATTAGFDRGLSDVAAGLSLSPDDPVLGVERGQLLLERALLTGKDTDLAAARADLVHLASTDPLNPDVQLALGVALANGGDDAGAEQAWLAAERLAPKSASAPSNLAALYTREGRQSEARTAAARARKIVNNGT
jgi:O-antigen ligase